MRRGSEGEPGEVERESDDPDLTSEMTALTLHPYDNIYNLIYISRFTPLSSTTARRRCWRGTDAIFSVVLFRRHSVRPQTVPLERVSPGEGVFALATFKVPLLCVRRQMDSEVVSATGLFSAKDAHVVHALMDQGILREKKNGRMEKICLLHRRRRRRRRRQRRHANTATTPLSSTSSCLPLLILTALYLRVRYKKLIILASRPTGGRCRQCPCAQF